MRIENFGSSWCSLSVALAFGGLFAACSGETANPNPSMPVDQASGAGATAADTTTTSATGATSAGAGSGGAAVGTSAANTGLAGATAGAVTTAAGGAATSDAVDSATGTAGATATMTATGGAGGVNPGVLTSGGATNQGGATASGGATALGGANAVAGASALGGASSAGAGGQDQSSGGMGNGGAAPSMSSSGCGVAASQATGQWVQEPNVTIEGTPREWFTWLPNNYDPTRAYPLVVLLHGCTGANNNVPVQNQSGDNAILVRGTGIADNVCWDASPNGPNLEFFDAMVDGTAAKSCVDENRIFAAGYSSGSWLIGVLNCLRADRLRAVGTVAGGNALFGNADCNGNVAAIFIHDQNDTENAWSNHEATMNRLIEANGCSSDDPVAEDPEPCVRYQGCGENPVKFCPTTGKGHDRQDQYASQAFWNFFSEF